MEKRLLSRPYNIVLYDIYTVPTEHNHMICLYDIYCTCPEKKILQFDSINVLVSKFIKMKPVLMVKRNTNWEFNTLELYFVTKLMEMLLFKIGTLFRDVSKICKIRCKRISNYTIKLCPTETRTINGRHCRIKLRYYKLSR